MNKKGIHLFVIYIKDILIWKKFRILSSNKLDFLCLSLFYFRKSIFGKLRSDIIFTIRIPVSVKIVVTFVSQENTKVDITHVGQSESL